MSCLRKNYCWHSWLHECSEENLIIDWSSNVVFTTTLSAKNLPIQGRCRYEIVVKVNRLSSWWPHLVYKQRFGQYWNIEEHFFSERIFINHGSKRTKNRLCSFYYEMTFYYYFHFYHYPYHYYYYYHYYYNIFIEILKRCTCMIKTIIFFLPLAISSICFNTMPPPGSGVLCTNKFREGSWMCLSDKNWI